MRQDLQRLCHVAGPSSMVLPGRFGDCHEAVLDTGCVCYEPRSQLPSTFLGLELPELLRRVLVMRGQLFVSTLLSGQGC